MNLNQSIGGYFGIEINDLGSLYHDKAIALNTGRNSLEHILNCKKYKNVYIPYYTCDVILESLIKSNTPYTFYHIDENFFPQISTINTKEALLYTNYFGLMDNNIRVLKDKFFNIIIDNAQAFYDMPYSNIPTFYSPRKFFGIPDGGFVYNASELSKNEYTIDKSYNRFSHLLKSIEENKELSYDDFKQNDASLNNQPIKQMSALTKKILKGIDYRKQIDLRVANFKFIHNNLKNTNQLTPFIEQSTFTCPMIYPYWSKDNRELRKQLIIQKIFTATYWPNVLNWVGCDSLEYELVKNIIHIPVDQRYDENKLKRVIETIKILK